MLDIRRKIDEFKLLLFYIVQQNIYERCAMFGKKMKEYRFSTSTLIKKQNQMCITTMSQEFEKKNLKLPNLNSEESRKGLQIQYQ